MINSKLIDWRVVLVIHVWNSVTGAGCVWLSAGLLTYVSPSWLDDDGAPAASLLFHLGHALPGLLVRVVCRTNCDFVLDGAQAVQLNAALAGGEQRGRRWGGTRRPVPGFMAKMATEKNTFQDKMFPWSYLHSAVCFHCRSSCHSFPTMCLTLWGDLAGNETVFGCSWKL